MIATTKKMTALCSMIDLLRRLPGAAGCAGQFRWEILAVPVEGRHRHRAAGIVGTRPQGEGNEE
jgi:hypothetical protein